MSLSSPFKLAAPFFFFVAIALGQEKILEFDTDYRDTPFLMENSFTLVDETSTDFTIFLTKNSDIAAYHFDANLEKKGRLFSKQLANKFKVPLGGTIDGPNYTLFYSNKDKDLFAGITFDFEKRWSEVFELDFKLKKEIYLTHFIHKNKFYIIAASYRTNNLFLYGFETNGTFEKKVLDLSEYELYGAQNYPTRLKSTLGLDLPSKAISEMIWIQNGVPYSLDSMVSLIKLYVYEDSFYLVSDINRKFTQIISYNLKEEDLAYDQIEHPELQKDGLVNSHFLDDKLFQIKVNTKELVFRVSNVSSKEILHEYHVDKEGSLYSGSGPIRQRGGRYKKYRELEKTSQFLQKVGTSHPAIHVQKSGSSYNLYLGSVEEIDNGALQALAFVNPFVPLVTIGSLTLAVNPLALAFYKSSNTRAVYITESLDQNFQQTDTVVEDNVFYRINDYLKSENVKRFSAADVFKYKNSCLFGMLDKKTRKYSLRQFDLGY